MICALVMVLPAVLLLTISPYVAAQEEDEAGEPPNEVVLQETRTSTQDPLPGHEGHQAVLALPPRDDGFVWLGDATWVASKPVEMVVLHGYDSSALSNQTSTQFGEPLKAAFGDGEVAITLVKPESGTPVPSGSMSFAGNALAFHTLGGEPFSVTYTIDAIAAELTNQPDADEGDDQDTDEGDDQDTDEGDDQDTDEEQ